MGEIERDIIRMIVTVVKYLNAIRLATTTAEKKWKQKGRQSLILTKKILSKYFPIAIKEHDW